MVVILAVLADRIFGSPHSFPRLIDLVKKILGWEENLIIDKFKEDTLQSIMGLVLALANIALVFFLIRSLLSVLAFNKYLQLVVSVHLASESLRGNWLAERARTIKNALKTSKAVGRTYLEGYVARDTSGLDKVELIKATVESTARNSCDLVIGPLFFMAFGVEYAWVYKVISLMDDIWSKPQRDHRAFGFFPAKLDDLVNIIPARLTALLMVLTASKPFDRKNGARIAIRDHNNHLSPNAGWPMAAVVGLLDIALGGGAYYKGKYIKKPLIGDNLRPIRAKDIDDTIRIMRRTSYGFSLIYLVIILIIS